MKKLIAMIMASVALFVNGADARIEAIQNLPKGVHATTRNCEDCCGSGHKWVEVKRKGHVNLIGNVNRKSKKEIEKLNRMETTPCQKCRGTGKLLRYDKEYWEGKKKGYYCPIDPNGITNKK